MFMATYYGSNISKDSVVIFEMLYVPLELTHIKSNWYYSSIRTSYCKKKLDLNATDYDSDI